MRRRKSLPRRCAATTTTRPAAPSRIANETLIFALLALMLSIAAGIGSIVIVNFMIFLQARGVDYAVAVSLGTLFGPAQVGARVVERLFGSHYHPIWTMIASLQSDGDRPAAACRALSDSAVDRS